MLRQYSWHTDSVALWDVEFSYRPGIAGEFLATGPPGKSPTLVSVYLLCSLNSTQWNPLPIHFLFFFTNPFSKSRYFTFSCYTLFSWPECTVLDYKGQLTFFCWPFQLYDTLSSSGVFAMILPSDVASEPFNQHSAQLQSTHDNIFTQPTYYRNQCGSPRRGLHVFLKDLKCLLLELLFDVEVCRTYVFKRIVGSW